MLQDLVVDDYSAVKFFMPFDDFTTSPIPEDVDTYREYRRRTIEFFGNSKPSDRSIHEAEARYRSVARSRARD
jgi:hypothetical protein